MIQRVKELNGKSFSSILGTLNPFFQKGFAGAPQIQKSWSSKGPGGKQVEAILRVIATVKNKGVTGDHVVFSFVSRRVQPLQL